MINRERFVKVFNGEPVDRVPFLETLGYWRSCLDRWKKEGLAQDATRKTISEIIGFDGRRGHHVRINGLVYPEFEQKVIKEEENKIWFRNGMGGIAIKYSDQDFIPITIEGAVKDWDSWKRIKERLIWDTEGRFPQDFDKLCKEAEMSNDPIYTADLYYGFFGMPRELLGLEGLACMYYDDPDLVHEILDTLCDLWIGVYTKMQEKLKLDYFIIWEDMCGKTGPLVSPAIFREFMLPRYKRLTSALKENGCKHIMVDSDGDVRSLIPLWMEGGVDILFPWETQFGMDITEVRCKYPKLGMVGGINKHALEEGRAAIDNELKKVPFMLESGRFIPGLDHNVTPDVSWDNLLYFFDRLKEMIWKYKPNY